MRGGLSALCPRLIPAWAGKTLKPRAPTTTRGAHPRVGGENASHAQATSSTSGSSPRGRGKLILSTDRESKLGLIPAWAGKTTLDDLAARGVQAHPRAGGENYAPKGGAGTVSGSSPRGRGKLILSTDRESKLGLIPAWAGKTTLDDLAARGVQAHPRVGGENSACRGSARAVEGSSPRGRGKPHAEGLPVSATGLIPAWAGKTYGSHTLTVPSWAHPRVGGENELMAFATSSFVGSSPRGRGKPAKIFPAHHLLRLIPARAGKTD